MFEAAKQVVFYFGVLRDEYREGLIVVTDLSQTNIVNRALKKVRPELLARFGHSTKIHFCVLSV